MIPTLFLATLVIFAIVRFIPGSVIDLMISESPAEAGLEVQKFTAEVLRDKLGLNQPIYVQYGHWIAGIFRGDLGRSLWTKRLVLDTLAERLPVSLELGIFSLIFAMALAIPIGILSAVRQDTLGDYLGRTIAVLAISLPSFWIATIIIVYPAIYLNWSPPVEYIPLTKDPGGNLIQFLIPAAIQGMVMSGTTMRMTRTMMLEVLRQDYIRTAWSKGLRERMIIFRHAVRNAIIPVVTMVGVLAPVLVGGMVVIETIFSLPGIGKLIVDATYTRDYPIISGVNLLLAVVILLVNLAVDMTYGWLDPRIRYK